MTQQQQGFPNISSPFVDSRSGIINQTWLQFLISLWTRTGGGVGVGVTSFDGRTGDVVLNNSDIIGALGFEPANPASIAAAWENFIISPENPPALPPTGLDLTLPAGSAFMYGNVVLAPQVAHTFSDDSITDYWLQTDGTFLVEITNPAVAIPPRYHELLHFWSVSAQNGFIAAINLMANTYPVVKRPTDIARVVEQFIDYYVIRSDYTPWSNGAAVAFSQLIVTSAGYVYQVFNTSGNLGAVEPTYTGTDIFTSGSAELGYYCQSAYGGGLRYSLNNGSKGYFSNIAAQYVCTMKSTEGLAIYPYIKNYLINQFYQLVQNWQISSPYLLGMKVVADDYIWLCTAAGTTAATQAAFVSAQPHSIGQTVTDGSVVWTAIYPSYGSQVSFWMVVDRTFLGYSFPDAHDSDASTFISALWAYIQFTGDSSWLLGNSTQPDGLGGYLTYQVLLNDIYDINLSTQIANDLTKTFQDDISPANGSIYAFQFLEDNCESYSGFRSAGQLFALLSDAPRASDAITLQGTLDVGIYNLYSQTNGIFAYYFGFDTDLIVNDANIVYYPNLQCQIFPELHQVESVSNQMRQTCRAWVWGKWNNWLQDQGLSLGFPAAMPGYVAARFWQDTAKAYATIETIERYFLTNGLLISDFAYYVQTKNLLVPSVTMIDTGNGYVTAQDQLGKTYKVSEYFGLVAAALW